MAAGADVLTERPLLLTADHVMPEPGRFESGWAVAVSGERVVAVGPEAEVVAAVAGAERRAFPGAVLMPGLVNAHQHGRGISQTLLGLPDLPLERWINARRRRGAPDGGAYTLLAALEMLRNGVTSAVHANYAYGTGDYVGEVRAQIGAYRAAGLRVTFCVGAQDRGFVVYPPFSPDDLGPLPPGARRILEEARSPYAEGIAGHLALMDRILDEFGGDPLVTLCWGPAGPQWVSDPLFEAIAGHAKANGLGIHLHCLESPAQAHACRRLYPEGTLRHLERIGVLSPATVLAHCVHLSEDDIAVAAATGAVVAHNPGSNLRLSNGIAPVAKLLAASVPVALGTDNTALADDEDLFGELRLMSALARAGGGEAPDPKVLLSAVTVNGARAMQRPETVGRIAPGCMADLVAVGVHHAAGAFLDPDTTLAMALVARARGCDVRWTMVGGRVLWDGSTHPEADFAAAATAAAGVAANSRKAKGDVDEAVDALDGCLARIYGDG